MTRFYFVDAPDAVGRQEEIFGSDEKHTVYRSQEQAETATQDCAFELESADVDGSYSGVTFEVAETLGLPDWAERIL